MSITLPKVHILKNGLRVCVIPYKGVDSVTIHLKGRAGSNFEKQNEIGAAHLLEHININNGNKNKITSHGGKIIGVTSRDDVLHMVKVLKEDLLDGLDFLSNIFKKGAVSQVQLEKEKSVSIQELNRIKNMPEKLIGRIFHKVLYPNDRLAKLNIGGEEEIRRLTVNDVVSFRDRLYFPNNFVLVLSGDVQESAILPYIRRFFEEFPKGQTAQHPVHKTTDDFQTQILIQPNLKQTHVKLSFYGYKISDDKKYASSVVSFLIDSYLKNLIKETLGHAYNISCSSFSGGSYGVFSIYFASEDTNVENILREIKRCVENFGNIVSSRNLEQVKQKLLTNFTFGFEKTSIRAEYYSDLLLHGRAEQNHEFETKKIKNLTIAEVKNVSEEIFSQEPKITVVTSDDKLNVGKIWQGQKR